ncbi:MAG: M1 family metallopeptidase [Mangrovibacterium sp.]
MVRFILLSGLLIIIASCAPVQLPVEKGISRQLADWRSRHISEVEYDLDFRIPEAIDKPVTAHEVIRFCLQTRRNDLQLDFKSDSAAVSRITCNGEAMPAVIKDEHIRIEKKYLKTGRNVLELTFTAPDQSLNRNAEFLYTLFVPDRASTAFPCFDQPDLKAQFRLSLDVPASWQAVANGAAKQIVPSGTRRQYRFARTEPLPTYLFAFSAGKFDTISRTRKGHRYTLYHRETDTLKVKSNVEEIFKLLFLSIDQIEAYTGIPLPFPKYDLVAVPSFQYNGMEHPGAVLYRSSSLFLEGMPTRQELLQRANLIAHETAHMWFGDLVTMPWFDEVWLKEVFANFIADKVVSPLFPEFDQDLLFLLAHQYPAYGTDRTGGTHPVGQELDNLRDAGTLYGPVIYHKAPVIMKMLEKKIGAETLRKGLHRYLHQFSFGNAGWRDLIALLDTTGSLKEWSDAWVYRAGRPHLHARIDNDDLVIDQTDPSGENRCWQQAVELVWPDGDSLKRQVVELEDSQIRIRDLFSGGIPEWLYLNGNGQAYAYVEMDKPAQQFFIRRLAGLDDDLLRAAVWTDLYENLMQGDLTPGGFLQAVMNNLPEEKHAVIFERILLYLEDVYVYRADQETREAYAEQTEHLIGEEMKRRPDQRNALTRAVIRLYSSSGALSRLYQVWKYQVAMEGYTPTERQQNDLAFYLALKWPERAEEILNVQESRLTNPDERRRFQFIRQSLDPDQAARNAFFTSLLRADNREHEPWVNDALAFLNHPLREPESIRYIRPGLEVLQEIQLTGDIFFPQSWLDNLLTGHHSPAAADTVRRFLKEHPDYPETLKRKILKSADFLLKSR